MKHYRLNVNLETRVCLRFVFHFRSVVSVTLDLQRNSKNASRLFSLSSLSFKLSSNLRSPSPEPPRRHRFQLQLVNRKFAF